MDPVVNAVEKVGLRVGVEVYAAQEMQKGKEEEEKKKGRCSLKSTRRKMLRRTRGCTATQKMGCEVEVGDQHQRVGKKDSWSTLKTQLAGSGEEQALVTTTNNATDTPPCPPMSHAPCPDNLVPSCNPETQKPAWLVEVEGENTELADRTSRNLHLPRIQLLTCEAKGRVSFLLF